MVDCGLQRVRKLRFHRMRRWARASSGVIVSRIVSQHLANGSARKSHGSPESK